MSGLPILTYHAIDDSGSVIATPFAHFVETLRTLAAEGFRCVDVADWIDQGRPPLERAFALTFDDGLASIRRAAEPIHRFGFTATVFLVAGRMGRDNLWPGQPSWVPKSSLIDWPELDDLRQAGFAFGSHSMTHPRRIGRENIDEIGESKRIIEGHTGEPCRLFAYPYGRTTRSGRQAVGELFAGGLGTRADRATATQDVRTLSRIDAFDLRKPRGVRHLIDGTLADRLRARRWVRFAKRTIGIA